MQDQVKILLSYLQGVWLKRRYILIFAWILCPIGWAFVTMLPNKYTSDAKVYADTQSILRPLLRGLAIQTDPSQRLNLMAKTLLNSRNLEIIGQEVDANVRAKTEEEYREILDKLKSGIRINSAGRHNLYSISYTGDDPVYAKNVVQAALNVFIESTLGGKRLDAEEANDVINDQISFYEKRLVDAEKALADFKRENMGVMPGSDKSYYSKLQTESLALEDAELALEEAQSSLAKAQIELDKEKENSLNQLHTVRTEYDGRIEAVQMRLDELLFRYTNNHPDVIESKRQLYALRQLKNREMKRLSSEEILKDNPIYQNLKISINQLSHEIASLEVRVTNHKSNIVELQSKLDLVPEIEAKLTNLTRNYNVTRAKYHTLAARGETASISSSIDAASEDIKFRIIEPPKVPTSPSGPNRLLLLILVLLASLGLGATASFLMSQINPVISSTSQLYRVTGIPVFGVITATENSGLLSQERRKLVIFIGLSVLLVVALFFSITINMMPSISQTFRS